MVFNRMLLRYQQRLMSGGLPQRILLEYLLRTPQSGSPQWMLVDGTRLVAETEKTQSQEKA